MISQCFLNIDLVHLFPPQLGELFFLVINTFLVLTQNFNLFDIKIKLINLLIISYCINFY